MNPKTQEFRERQARQLKWLQNAAAAKNPMQAMPLEPAAIEQVEAELAARGAVFNPVELRLPETLDMEGWAAIGRRLCRADQVMQWWLGDWAAFGLRKFEGMEDSLSNIQHRTSNNQHPTSGTQPLKPRRGALKEFAESHGLNYGTLRNLAWVSSKVELSRRRDTVEWSKHAEVAPLPAKEQKKWLEKVETENLPRAVLRQQIRLSQGEDNALASDGPVFESARKHLDAFMASTRRHPDPTENTTFWTTERRTIWKEWLEPVLEFAGRL